MNEKTKHLILSCARSKITKAIDYILNSLLIMILLILLIYQVRTVYYIHIGAFATFLYFVINPILRRIIRNANGYPITKLHICLLMIRIFLFITLFFHMYFILYVEDITYFNYIQLTLSGLSMILINEYEKTQIIIRDQEKNFKTLRIGTRIVTQFFICGLIIFQMNFFGKTKEIHLNTQDLIYPQVLQIQKRSRNLDNGIIPRLSLETTTSIILSDRELINELISELKNEPLKVLKGFETLNYQLKYYNYLPDYWVYFVYKDESTKDLDYILSLFFNEQGMVRIQYYDTTTQQLEHYPFKISKVLTNKLIKFYEHN